MAPAASRNPSVLRRQGWNRRLRLSIAALGVTTIIAGCGAETRELAAAQISPAPVVDDVPLPDLTDGGTARRLVADPGRLLIVYFGYTSCPDFCPTTMSDVAAARNRLDDPAAIQVAMVTIDPDRDLDVLPEYVTSFFDDGIALGTPDPGVLAAAAAPFGVSYSVDPNPDAVDDPAASPVIVAHTTALYAVDDTGHLVMTWQYGTSVDDLTADIEQYLADPAAATPEEPSG